SEGAHGDEPYSFCRTMSMDPRPRQRRTTDPRRLFSARQEPCLRGSDGLDPSTQALYTEEWTHMQVRTLRLVTGVMVCKALIPRQVAQVHEILTTICDKWAVLILYHLSHDTKRHGELQRAIPGVSQKMLTQTLRKLARDRLVRRTVYPVVPPRV